MMAYPGLVPQSCGKLRNRKYVRSQICADHKTNVKHVFHMEDFTTESTLKGKAKYEAFIEKHGCKVRSYRADNG